jgi:hypothetical protein
MRVLTVLLFAIAGAAAADRPPFYVCGGFGTFDSEIRTLTNKFPWLVGIGWGEAERALFGSPSLDLEWIHAAGKGNKFDSWGITYNERAVLSESLYFGLGIGSYFSKIRATSESGQVYDGHRIFPGGRAMLGMSLTNGIFTEFAYTYRGKVEGLQANNLSLTLGWWF